MSACDFCGEPYALELLEVLPEGGWDGGPTFELGACCADALDDAVAYIRAALNSTDANALESIDRWFMREAGVHATQWIRGLADEEMGA
jgi:hypothetical protein